MAAAEVRRLQRLRTVGRLTAGLAHDLNNVLGAAVGALDPRAAIDSNPRLREELRESLQHGIRLLRTLARHALEDRRGREKVSLPSLVEDTVALLGAYLRHRRVDVVLSQSAEATVRVHRADATEILIQLLLHGVATLESDRRITVDSGTGQRGDRRYGTVSVHAQGRADADRALRALCEAPERGFEEALCTVRDHAPALVDSVVALHFAGGIFECRADGEAREFVVGFPIVRHGGH